MRQPAAQSTPPPYRDHHVAKFSQLPRDRPAESERKTVSVKDKNNQQFVTSQRGERNPAVAGRFFARRANQVSECWWCIGHETINHVTGPCDVRMLWPFESYTKGYREGSDLQLM